MTKKPETRTTVPTTVQQEGETHRQPRGMSWFELAIQTAKKNYSLLAGYFVSIGAMATPVFPILPDQYRWFPFAIGTAFLVISVGYHGTLAYRDRRLARSGIGGNVRPSYFRLVPYQDTDRDKFERADRYHEQILSWLQESSGPILYLTGSSGTGKSSLLNAYVLPRLREASPGSLTIVIRSYQNPLDTLCQELLKPGQFWKNPPQDLKEIPELLSSALPRIKPRRVLLVFDQFEKFLAIHGRDSARMQAIEELLRSLTDASLPGLTTLLVLRQDRMAVLHSLQLRKVLPLMNQEENWKMVPSFTEQAAREFLVGSGVNIPPTAMENIFQHLAEVEGSPGEIRQITANIVGLMLERTVVSAEPRIPRYGTGGELVREYIRRCLSRPELPERTPLVLERMITERGDTNPKSIKQLARDAKLKEEVVLQCLNALYGVGLVRCIDDEENIWEVSHDFVARILADVLPSLRLTPSQRLRALIPRKKPWYTRYTSDQIRQPLPNGEYCLHLAVRQKDVTAVEYFLDHDAGKNAKDANQITPLHLSAWLDLSDVTELLLQHGADVGARDKSGESPLHKAAGNDHPIIAGLLLDRQADITAADQQGNTPLHVAAYRGHSEVAELLLKRGAELDAKNNSGVTPLCRAAGRGHAPVVALLLERGADTRIRNVYGETPLHEAAENGHPEIVNLLLDAGAGIQDTKNYGDSPLHVAAEHGQRSVAARLLQRGADVRATDQFSRTPLYEAAAKGHRDIAALLLDSGADPQAADSLEEDTPVHIAAKNGHQDVVTLLIDRGVSMGITNKYGRTPLHLAAQAGRHNVVNFLLDRSDDINLTDAAGNMAMHFAAIAGYTELAALLLRRGADVNAAEHRGWTPLHFAAGNGRPETVSLLLKNGAQVNPQNEAGDTPAHRAALSGKRDVLAILLSEGADIHATNHRGNSLLHEAAEGGYADVIRLLVEKGANPAASNDAGKLPSDLVSDPLAADALLKAAGGDPSLGKAAE